MLSLSCTFTRLLRRKIRYVYCRNVIVCQYIMPISYIHILEGHMVSLYIIVRIVLHTYSIMRDVFLCFYWGCMERYTGVRSLIFAITIRKSTNVFRCKWVVFISLVIMKIWRYMPLSVHFYKGIICTNIGIY